MVGEPRVENLARTCAWRGSRLLPPLCAELVTYSQPSSAPTLREVLAKAWECVHWDQPG